ncbi:MAG: HAD family hydrolase [Planctomycetes bacterium]|nr:HAD family hydrolase [Planctomycetota bacterium]
MTITPGPSEQPIGAVVFDLDDTLSLERDYVRSGYRTIAKLLGERFPQVPDIEQWMWQRFCLGQTANMFNAAGEHFNLHLSDVEIAELVLCYRNHRPTIRPDPEATEALGKLRGPVKLALLSDGFLPAQQLKLDALGLADSFDVVLFTESLGRGCWKPCPVGFQRVAEQLNVPPTVCVYVADNPAKDFVAPNALGWLTIQWCRPGQLHADKPAPQGGRPQKSAGNCDELLAALGLAGGGSHVSSYHGKRKCQT